MDNTKNKCLCNGNLEVISINNKLLKTTTRYGICSVCRTIYIIDEISTDRKEEELYEYS